MPFVLHVTVQPDQIDELNHVNNVVYIKWVQDAAVAHSTSLGMGYPEYLARRQAFLVRRHEIDYLRPAVVGEAIEVETRVTFLGAATTTRQTEIRRSATGEVIARAVTGWVYIDLVRSRPTRITDDLRTLVPLDPSFAWAATAKG